MLVCRYSLHSLKHQRHVVRTIKCRTRFQKLSTFSLKQSYVRITFWNFFEEPVLVCRYSLHSYKRQVNKMGMMGMLQRMPGTNRCRIRYKIVIGILDMRRKMEISVVVRVGTILILRVHNLTQRCFERATTRRGKVKC